MTTQIALVGAAHIHTPNFIKKLAARTNEVGDIAVKYVWDHNRDRAERRAAELNALVVADSSAIWEDAAISSVVICSETKRHEALVLAGAEAGKNMFVEKPLGLGRRDSYAMADAIEKAGVIFQTGYFMRGNPIYRFLKEELAAGNLGKITRYRTTNCHPGSLKGWFDTEWRWMADPVQAGCGAFGDLGTHVLDIMLWLLGDVERVAAQVDIATGRYGDCDEFGEGLLKFKDGTVGSLAAGWVDIADPVRLLISGTAGFAYVHKDTLYYQSEKVPGADGQEPWKDLPEAWSHAFDLFLDAITGTPGVPLVTAREAAYRSAVMEALYSAAKEQTWVRL